MDDLNKSGVFHHYISSNFLGKTEFINIFMVNHKYIYDFYSKSNNNDSCQNRLDIKAEFSFDNQHINAKVEQRVNKKEKRY